MNVFSFCHRCSWIISWLDSYIFISDATAPKTLMLAFCRQSHMQEPRPARPECPACSRAPGSGQWVWESGSGGAHTARRAGGWFGPFLCLLRKKEGKKILLQKQTPLQTALQDVFLQDQNQTFFGCESVLCTGHKAADKTEQGGICPVPRTCPGLRPHHRGGHAPP